MRHRLFMLVAAVMSSMTPWDTGPEGRVSSGGTMGASALTRASVLYTLANTSSFILWLGVLAA